MALSQKRKLHFEKSVQPDFKLGHKCRLILSIPAVRPRTLSLGSKRHYSYFIQ